MSKNQWSSMRKATAKGEIVIVRPWFSAAARSWLCTVSHVSSRGCPGIPVAASYSAIFWAIGTMGAVVYNLYASVVMDVRDLLKKGGISSTTQKSKAAWVGLVHFYTQYNSEESETYVYTAYMSLYWFPGVFQCFSLRPVARISMTNDTSEIAETF